MANRGQKNQKEYRVQIGSLKQWLQETDYEGLLCVEIFSSWFGASQVIKPTINQIMLNVDGAEDKVKWLVINVAKLEEEQRDLLLEEEKKKIEMEGQMRRKALDDGEDVNGVEDKKEEDIQIDVEKIKIPKLESYSGYEEARPLWLILRNGEILHEIPYCNPPKLTYLINCYCSETEIDEEELEDLEIQEDIKEAGTSAKEVKEVFIPRAMLTIRAANLGGDHPQCVLWQKENKEDEEWTKVVDSTEMVKGTDPSFDKIFYVHDPNKSRGEEWEDDDDDDASLAKFKPRLPQFLVKVHNRAAGRPLDECELLGQVEIDMENIVNEESGEIVYKLCDADGNQLPGTTDEFGSTLEPCLVPRVQLESNAGKRVLYEVRVVATNLPCAKDTGKTDPLVLLYANDLNLPHFTLQAQTEAAPGEANPTFIAPMQIESYANFDREVMFSVSDVDVYSQHDSFEGEIGSVKVSLAQLVEAAKDEDSGEPQDVELDLLDQAGEPLTSGAKVALAVKAVPSPVNEYKSAAHERKGGVPQQEVSLKLEGLQKGKLAQTGATTRAVCALYGYNTQSERYDVYMGQTDMPENGPILDFLRPFVLDKAHLPVRQDSPLINGRPSGNHEDDYMVRVFDMPVDADGDLSQGENLGECEIRTKELVDAGPATFSLIDMNGEVMTSTTLTATVRGLGVVTTHHLSLSSRHMPPATNAELKAYAVVEEKSAFSDEWRRWGTTECVPVGDELVFKQKVIVQVASKRTKEVRVSVWSIPDSAIELWGGGTKVTEESQSTLIGRCMVEFNKYMADPLQTVSFAMVDANDGFLQGAPGDNGEAAEATIITLCTEKDLLSSFDPLDAVTDPTAEVEDPEAPPPTSRPPQLGFPPTPKPPAPSGAVPRQGDTYEVGSKWAIQVSAAHVPRHDSVGVPLLALVGQNSVHGQYDTLLDTSELPAEADQHIAWRKVFYVDHPLSMAACPSYQFSIYDASSDEPLELDSDVAAATHKGKASFSLADVVAAGGSLLLPVDKVNFTGDESLDSVQRSRLLVRAINVGRVSSVELSVSADNLPRTEETGRVDPVVECYVGSPFTPTWILHSTTEVVADMEKPEFETKISLNIAKDTLVKLRVLDANQGDLAAAPLLGDATVVGEVLVDMADFLRKERAEEGLSYQLHKGNQPLVVLPPPPKTPKGKKSPKKKKGKKQVPRPSTINLRSGLRGVREQMAADQKREEASRVTFAVSCAGLPKMAKKTPVCAFFLRAENGELTYCGACEPITGESPWFAKQVFITKTVTDEGHLVDCEVFVGVYDVDDASKIPLGNDEEQLIGGCFFLLSSFYSSTEVLKFNLEKNDRDVYGENGPATLLVSAPGNGAGYESLQKQLLMEAELARQEKEELLKYRQVKSINVRASLRDFREAEKSAVVVMYGKNERGEWVYDSQTNLHANENDIDFYQSLPVIKNEAKQLKFSVYEPEDPEDIKGDDLVGEVVLDITPESFAPKHPTKIPIKDPRAKPIYNGKKKPLQLLLRNSLDPTVLAEGPDECTVYGISFKGSGFAPQMDSTVAVATRESAEDEWEPVATVAGKGEEPVYDGTVEVTAKVYNGKRVQLNVNGATQSVVKFEINQLSAAIDAHAEAPPPAEEKEEEKPEIEQKRYTVQVTVEGADCELAVTHASAGGEPGPKKVVWAGSGPATVEVDTWEHVSTTLHLEAAGQSVVLDRLLNMEGNKTAWDVPYSLSAAALQPAERVEGEFAGDEALAVVAAHSCVAVAVALEGCGKDQEVALWSSKAGVKGHVLQGACGNGGELALRAGSSIKLALNDGVDGPVSDGVDGALDVPAVADWVDGTVQVALGDLGQAKQGQATLSLIAFPARELDVEEAECAEPTNPTVISVRTSAAKEGSRCVIYASSPGSKQMGVAGFSAPGGTANAQIIHFSNYSPLLHVVIYAADGSLEGEGSARLSEYLLAATNPVAGILQLMAVHAPLAIAKVPKLKLMPNQLDLGNGRYIEVSFTKKTIYVEHPKIKEEEPKEEPAAEAPAEQAAAADEAEAASGDAAAAAAEPAAEAEAAAEAASGDAAAPAEQEAEAAAAEPAAEAEATAAEPAAEAAAAEPAAEAAAAEPAAEAAAAEPAAEAAAEPAAEAAAAEPAAEAEATAAEPAAEAAAAEPAAEAAAAEPAAEAEAAAEPAAEAEAAAEPAAEAEAAAAEPAAEAAAAAEPPAAEPAAAEPAA